MGQVLGVAVAGAVIQYGYSWAKDIICDLLKAAGQLISWAWQSTTGYGKGKGEKKNPEAEAAAETKASGKLYEDTDKLTQFLNEIAAKTDDSSLKKELTSMATRLYDFRKALRGIVGRIDAFAERTKELICRVKDDGFNVFTAVKMLMARKDEFKDLNKEVAGLKAGKLMTELCQLVMKCKEKTKHDPEVVAKADEIETTVKEEDNQFEKINIQLKEVIVRIVEADFQSKGTQDEDVRGQEELKKTLVEIHGKADDLHHSCQKILEVKLHG